MPRTNVPGTESQEPVNLADWAEAELVVSGRSYLTRTHVRDGLRDTLLSEDRNELEILVESIFLEVARRRRVAPASYPFVATRRIERDRDVPSLAYDFCLCLTVSDAFREEHRSTEAAVRFEYLILDALKGFLGPESEGVRFGWPPSDGRPGGFEDALEWLVGSVGLRRGPAPARAASNDGGVDVVVWRSFPDDLPGHLVILGQGTVARRWTGKERDVVEDVWRGFVDFLKDPVIAFGLPCVVRPGDNAFWEELSRSAHLVLDRLRLTNLVAGRGIVREVEIREWTEQEILKLRGDG